jgi:carbamoyltransferase
LDRAGLGRRSTNLDKEAILGTRFKALTGCPVLVNTSFNVRGEPICCTPEDAFRCFMGSEIDSLVAGNWFLRKEDQDPALHLDYRHRFDPD